MNDRHRLKTDLLALGLLAATVFVALSLFSHDPGDPPAATVYPARTAPLNTCGTLGAFVSHVLHSAFGVGAWFVLVVMVVVDVRLFSRKTEHDPLVRGFGVVSFSHTDEIFVFRDFSRKRARVLLRLDTAQTDMNKPSVTDKAGDYPLSWIRREGQGRVFYSALGHQKDVYWRPAVLQHYLAGIQFAGQSHVC